MNTSPPPFRVVWIIFDEMDQRLSFPARPDGLKLPELDRLRAESIHSENAYPPAGHTLLSMPGLFTGYAISAAKPVSSDDLLLTLADSNKTVHWSQLTNVFAEARSLGCNTALVGYFHPYSRLLGRALNFCEWRSFPYYEPTRDRSFWLTLQKQVRSMLPAILVRFLQVDLYHATLASSLQVVTNANYNLIHLHLPVPHKPALYRPESDRITPLGRPFPAGYFDNLQLADRTLGRLRSAMEQSGLWDKTWVIVSADHWWRESARYDGKVDHRVPFILKAPGRNVSQAYEPDFATAQTRDLILAILRGEVLDQAAASAWLDHHRAPANHNYGDSAVAD